MTREEIIDGLKFTVDMCLFNATTGETYTEPRNDMDKITFDACRGAIELLEQKLCDDAVSRQAVLEQTYNWSKDEFLRVANPFDYLRKRINSLPSVKQEPKTGHWIMTNDYLTTAYGSIDYVKCSCCGEDSLEEGDFCPNCGADMKEGDA